ncbi:putative O-glycosylation ligase, exosortase A system-associated [Geoalkalibacter halelectricus]|uniref:putative O-glycosylation ligase, exosortase A system-associated n=1 Tax=Geoalkalibacter halelectricus TaxID=2847045 RepID=UPI003D1B79C6
MRDLIFLIVWAGSLPIIFFRPWTGVLVWSWIGYMNPHMLGWGMVRSLPVAMAVGLVTIVALVFTRDRKGVPWTAEMILLVLLAIHFTVTTYFAWAPEAAWMQWDKVMKVLLFTFITTMLIFGRFRIHALLLVIALSIGFYGFKGGLFSLLTGGAHRVYGPGASFIGDNNSLGLAMIMILPMLFFLGREEPRKWLRNGLYVVAAFTVIAIVFTYSRGALLGLACISLFLFLKTKRKLFFVVLILPILMIGVQFIPEAVFERAGTIRTYEEDASAMGRIQAWGAALNIANTHPFTGGGFENFRAPEIWAIFADPDHYFGGVVPRATHSIYFDVLGHHGWVGFIIFVSIIIVTMLRSISLQKISKKYEDLNYIGNYALCIQLALIGYMTTGAFLSLAYFDLFYALVALSAILQREVNEKLSREKVMNNIQNCIKI